MMIKLQRGMVTEIDDEDWDKVKDYHWYAQKRWDNKNKWYVATGVKVEKNGRSYWTTLQIQRLILDTPEGFCSDHKDGNPLNNKKENLRICTSLQNAQNKRWHCKNKTGFKGVVFDKETGKFIAQISVNFKHKNLGRFKNKKDAAIAYNAGAKQYYGEFATLNKIDGE